jgi:hypothetical protein
MKERLLGPRPPGTAMTAHNRALVLHDRQRAAEAQELIERVLECRDSFREIVRPAPR